MVLSRNDILTADDIVQKKVSVPEWGGDVLITTMTGKQRDRFESKLLETRGPKRNVNMANMRASLCAITICDEQGKLIFNSNGDVQALGEKSGAALDRCFEVAVKLNRIGDKDIDDLVKNSESGQSDDSGSV